MIAPPPGFADRIVRWQQSHGRHALPWQAPREPYRVWLSEIMLQQTQVATVLRYYQRFLARFPDVQALAAATEDDVMAQWSGLGYYSRARNLHLCAREVVQRHGGEFPRSAAELEKLPGIGRSTAAAIASFCHGERVAIFDGNVKRVLSRILGYRGDLASAARQRQLWAIAAQLLPTEGLQVAMPRYTQGLMDLGATVCLPRRPACKLCPVNDLCEALREGEPENYPVNSATVSRSAQSMWLLRAQTRDGAVWLHKRPADGVWGGLYCLPVYDTRDALEFAVPGGALPRDAAPIKHVLTHKDLHLHPVDVRLARRRRITGEGEWFAADEWPALGLPAPIRALLET